MATPANVIETNIQLAEMMRQMATNFNTVYALGMWGFRIEEETITAKAKQQSTEKFYMKIMLQEQKKKKKS